MYSPTTSTLDFSAVLQTPFTVSHLVMRKGYDTPNWFICPKGLRPWSRFFCLQTGTVRFTTDHGTAFLARPGDIVYLPHDVVYTSGWTDKENGWYYSIEFILTGQDGSIIDFSEEMQLVFSNVGDTYDKMIAEMAETYTSGAPDCRIHCQELFLHFLRMLIGKYNKTRLDHTLSPIYDGILYLESHYIQDVTTKELARLCNISESHFRRLFHRYTSLSPIAYRNMLRMRHAKELLETGLYTVSEAAVAVNIPDVFYFNKMFRHFYTYAPSCAIPKTNE